MRLLVRLVILLMVAAMCGTVVYSNLRSRSEEALRELAQDELARFQARIHVEAATLAASRAPNVFPPTIDPDWFEGELPHNVLLGSGRPWVEIAPLKEWPLHHPPNLAATTPDDAAYWYNPATGTLRARVPLAVSDQRTRELYQEINGASVGREPVLAVAEPSADGS